MLQELEQIDDEAEAAKAWPDLIAMVIGFILTGIFVAFLHQWITGMPVI